MAKSKARPMYTVAGVRIGWTNAGSAERKFLVCEQVGDDPTDEFDFKDVWEDLDQLTEFSKANLATEMAKTVAFHELISEPYKSRIISNYIAWNYDGLVLDLAHAYEFVKSFNEDMAKAFLNHYKPKLEAGA